MAAPKAALPLAPAPPEEALLKVENWQKTPLEPVRPTAIDEMISREWVPTRSEPQAPTPAPLTTDEQFVRRVFLDVAGRLPSGEEIERFITDKNPEKRAALIDQLLASDDFARHWGHYWTDVASSRTSPYMRRLTPVFEEWMVEQFRENRGWGETVRAMLTAEAVLTDSVKHPPDVPRFVPQAKNGAAYFVATRYYEKTRDQAAVDLAAETSRVFMGIQLQCCQCHDHPFDQWKREQFHQIAAFFARSGGRPRYADNPGALGTYGLAYYPDGEYEMPDHADPTKMYLTHPAFLDGRSPGTDMSDRDRRQALAGFITDKNNYWFSAAFINRVWGELMGQAFYEPVDDLGPGRDAVMRPVLTRLTGAFRGSDYDVKALFRVILNTQAYERQARLGTSPQQHLRFAAVHSSAMRPEVTYRVLHDALAPSTRPAKFDPNEEKRHLTEFMNEFQVDPSARPEGTFSGVLWFMNSYVVNSQIAATRANPLVAILKNHPQDDDAINALYARTLGRRPTEREMGKCRAYIQKAGKRNEAFEDLMWVLVNSAEFHTKR